MEAYTVNWRIDLEGNSPTDVVKQAMEIMQDKDSTATAFEVEDTKGNKTAVDLIFGTAKEMVSAKEIIRGAESIASYVVLDEDGCTIAVLRDGRDFIKRFNLSLEELFSAKILHNLTLDFLQQLDWGSDYAEDLEIAVMEDDDSPYMANISIEKIVTY